MAESTATQPPQPKEEDGVLGKGSFVLYKDQRARIESVEAPVPGDTDRYYNIKLEDGRDINVPGSKLQVGCVQSPAEAMATLKARRKADAAAKKGITKIEKIEKEIEKEIEAENQAPVPVVAEEVVVVAKDGGDGNSEEDSEESDENNEPEQNENETNEDGSEKKKSKKKKKKTRQQLHVLPFVIDYQRQNGLRHEDYERYRRFCSRRLRRLRTSLKFPCGKKRFKKQSITRDLVTDERYLHIMLFTAERAWAYYVQLKEEAKTDSHKKFHMIGRLRRATLYAQELSEIVGNDGKLCDERTELETRAYAAWMQALCSREHQSWKDALENFGASKHIYERLGNVCGEVNKPLYAKKVEEIDAQIRYSSFMLGESGVDISTLLASGGAEMDMLKEKFARVVEDSDKSETDTLSSISWRGRVVPVQSQKLQLSILKIRSKEKALDQAKNFAAVMEAYDELFLEFGEAKSIIVDEIQAEKKSSSEADIGHLEFSYDYMEYTHLESTVTRTMRMIDDATAKFDADGGAGNPDEIVRFYDMMLQNLVDMEDINTLQDDHEFSKELAGRTCLYKALRCLYLAQAQLNVDSNKGAVALLERGATHARLSQSEFSECVEPMSKSNSALMKMFQEEVRRKRCLIQAKVFMKDMEAEKEVTSKAEAAARSGTLYENMDSYDLGARSVSKKPNLVQFPPAFVPTPCKPLFFDLASNYIDFPDVEKRAAPPKAERNQSGSWGLPTFGLWGN